LTRFKQFRDDRRLETVQSKDNDLLEDADLPVVSMAKSSGVTMLRCRYQITHSLPRLVKPETHAADPADSQQSTASSLANRLTQDCQRRLPCAQVCDRLRRLWRFLSRAARAWRMRHVRRISSSCSQMTWVTVIWAATGIRRSARRISIRWLLRES